MIDISEWTFVGILVLAIPCSCGVSECQKPHKAGARMAMGQKGGSLRKFCLKCGLKLARRMRV